MPMDNMNDEQRLAQLGHKQELQRRFSLPALIALCLCLMATWEALSTVIASALISGGPACLLYNYILSFIGTICIAVSLGEMAAIWPTSGGQYHWTASIAPPSSKIFAAFATGWISIGGQIILTASAAFAAGLQFQACITLNHADYVPQRWHGMLFYWAVVVYAFVMNMWGVRLLPHVNTVSGVLHVAGFVAIFVTLGVLSKKNTAEFVFATTENNSGWSNDGVSWLIGLQSAVYPMLGYDAASHVAEEIHNPSRNVPLAMISSVIINGLVGLAYCIMLLYSSPSLDMLLSTPTGFPFMQIFLDATKSQAGATVMSLIICAIATAAAAAGTTSTSRTLWAFARDKGTPFHPQLSKVSPGLDVPVLAIILVTVLQMVLGFIYLGNSTAFNAILSMAIIGMYLSYASPVAFLLFHGRRRLSRGESNPLRLPRTIGQIVNIIALGWMVICIVFSTFPTTMPVTEVNMNYSIVVLAAWLGFGGIYYTMYGRHKFEVPVVDVAVLCGVPESQSLGSQALESVEKVA